MVQYHEQPLAVAFQKHAHYLFKRGVRKFKDLWDFNSLDWASWTTIKHNFLLHNRFKEFIIFVKSLVPIELAMKICTPLECNFSKDWSWLSTHQFGHFPLRKIYLNLVPPMPLNPRLNNKWNCKFNENTWRNLSAQIWLSKAEANAQLLAWKVLQFKLLVGSRLRCLLTQPAKCLFCL